MRGLIILSSILVGLTALAWVAGLVAEVCR
jgi:hypothetical protein